MRDESFGNGLNPGGWLDLFDAGVAGQAALARLVLVIASAWVVLRPERVIDPTTQLPAIAIPTLAAVTLGLSRTAGDLAALGVIAGIAHALAMAVWIGGLLSCWPGSSWRDPGRRTSSTPCGASGGSPDRRS